MSDPSAALPTSGLLPSYAVERLGVLMEPQASEPLEAWGVCNPGSARARDGTLYLFPRLVAAGNHSRIGRARVLVDDHGSPAGVERLGVALEPEESWERNAHTGGGLEDPRVTFVPTLDAYVMTYTALGPLGPRVALAVSEDLVGWRRLGPALFAYSSQLHSDFGLFPNKDAVMFPEPVPGPDGQPSYAFLHRPTWDLSAIREHETTYPPSGLTDPRPGIWVSYAPVATVQANIERLTLLTRHRLVALPAQPWEAVKIGAGSPPLRITEGWLVIYHGVSGREDPTGRRARTLRYAAGTLLLDPFDLTRTLARARDPLLEPVAPEEREGVIPNVVFPTGLEPVGDGAYVFYGMADTRIGVARLNRLE